MARLASPILLVACSALVGCGTRDYRYHRQSSGPRRSFSLPTCPSSSTPTKGVGIDTDAQLSTEAGKGAGVLVEYMSGGQWHVWTVCDTAVSGYACYFDITAQAIGGKVSNLLAEQLEPTDIATSYCADTAVLGVTTGNEFDGIWFDTEAGATVRITAALGDTLYENVFFWTTGGVVREDANSNPVEFTPSAP